MTDEARSAQVTTEPEKKKTFEDLFENNAISYYLKSYEKVRAHQASYFEKLALLNGGTVALTITAIVGKTPLQIRHRHFLQAGMCSLVLALLVLLARNFLWTRYEAKAVDLRFEMFGKTAKVAVAREQIDSINNIIGTLGFFGSLLTGLGMSLLLVVALSLF
jgi:hypothetical protein